MEKLSTTNLGVKNPWLLVKFSYYRFIISYKELDSILNIISNMEEIDGDKIIPLKMDMATVSFLSDSEYKTMKANNILIDE